MPITLPTKQDIINANIFVITHSTDPSDDKSDAGKLANRGESLDFALDPPISYNNVFEAAYGIARAIANDHTFINGNKRTATKVVANIFDQNSFNNECLMLLINALVGEDDDTINKNCFCSLLANLFIK